MPKKKASRLSHSPTALKKSKLPVSGQLLEAIRRIQDLEHEMSQVIWEMQEKVRQLECLNEFSNLMNSFLGEVDTAIVHNKALEATCKLVGCKTAALFLVDPKRGDLYWASKADQRLAINDQSIPGYVAMSGESIIANDVDKHPRQIQNLSELLGETVQTLICIPLRTKDRVIGVLQAMNRLPRLHSRSSRHEWPDFYGTDVKLMETLGHSISIAMENSRLYEEIKTNFFETVEALAEAIEKKDHYTGGHTKRVVYYSICISKFMNLSPEQLEQVRLGAILHDVGKIGIEDKILKKESALDPEEWKVMQTHPNLGYDILARVEGLKEVIGGMRYHHERWDGKGYPLGLKGEEIPLIARIIAVADTYDAMVSTRPYRKGIEPKLAFDEILKHRGTQFDPDVVDAFVKAFQLEKMGKGSGGSSLLSNCD